MAKKPVSQGAIDGAVIYLKTRVDANVRPILDRLSKVEADIKAIRSVDDGLSKDIDTLQKRIAEIYNMTMDKKVNEELPKYSDSWDRGYAAGLKDGEAKVGFNAQAYSKGFAAGVSSQEKISSKNWDEGYNAGFRDGVAEVKYAVEAIDGNKAKR